MEPNIIFVQKRSVLKFKSITRIFSIYKIKICNTCDKEWVMLIIRKLFSVSFEKQTSVSPRN